MRLVLTLAALLLPSLALPVLADTAPKLTKEEALQLFAAGGFPLKGQEVDNHCGQKANPSLTFTDMNGDGVDEAVFVDAGSCYPGGHWTAIVTKEGANWVPVLMAPATAQPVSHKTKGWYDVSVDFRTVKGVMQFDGTRYITGAAVPGNVTSSRKPKPAKRVKQPKVAVVPAPALSPVAPTPNAPKTRKDETLVTLGDKPTPAQAAAVKRAMHTEWAEVEQTEGHPVSYGVGEADLNGDGRPDLLLQADDMAYCGSGGCGAWALLATPQGYSTKAITLANFGRWLFVRAEVHHRMHDLRYDDANYVFRWNGRSYR
jgi:hypothetical protein